MNKKVSIFYHCVSLQNDSSSEKRIDCFYRKFFSGISVYLFAFLLFIPFNILYSPVAAATEGYNWRAAIHPFGIEDAYANLEDIDGADIFYGNLILEDLQVGWSRNGAGKYGGLNWNRIQPAETSAYLWEVVSPAIEAAYSSGINTMVTITPFARWDQAKCHEPGDTKLPCDMEAYRDFIIALVQQYGAMVQYWGIGNEIDGGLFWTDTAANYAVLVKETAEAIHSVDPDAKIVLGAIATVDFLKDFLTSLNGLVSYGERCFAVADIHYFRLATHINDTTYDRRLDYKGAKKLYDLLRPVYDRFGYEEVPIWMTETATYSNGPLGFWPYQQEATQAGDLVKRLVYPLAYGVDKVFWVTAVEWYNFANKGPNNYFDNCGLIRNPQHGAGSFEKLSYFTYKKLVEFLEDSDWGLTDFVQLSGKNHLYAVKFNNSSHSNLRYVVWWDWYDEYTFNLTDKWVSLPVNFVGQAQITPAVLPYASGKDVVSYHEAYATSSFVVPVVNGRISFVMHRSPLFIQQAGQ